MRYCKSRSNHFQLLLTSEKLRAKAVIHRDYEELRAKRFALENPQPVIEEPEIQTMQADHTDMNGISSVTSDPEQDAAVTIKEEMKQADSPEKQAVPVSQTAIKEEASQPANDVKTQNLTPPSSGNANGQAESKPIGLGIVTDGAGVGSGSETVDIQNSSIDSLFGPDDNNGGDSTLDFDNMDFLPDTNTNTHGNDQSQAHDEFDLSSFGNTAQDFSMPDLNISMDVNSNTNNATTSNNANKANDDPFASLGIGSGGDSMELDLEPLGMDGAAGSVFDDIFFDDDNNTGEMQHGEFDDDFFGLKKNSSV